MLDRTPQAPLGLPGRSQALAAHYDLPLRHMGGYETEVETERDDSLNPLKLLLLALHYRFLLLTLIVVGLFGGVIYTYMQTPKYQASTRVEIMMPSAKVFQDMEMVSEGTDMRAFLTAREKLRSRALAQRVAFQLGLTERADFLFPKPEFSVFNVLSRAFGLHHTPAVDETTPETREKIAIGRLLDNLGVELVNNTSLLAITYRDQNRQYAAEIANQFAQSFIDQRVDQTSQTSDLARQFIQDQVIQVKARLQTAEKELVDYAKTARITATGEDSSLIASNIQELNKALSAAIQEKLDSGRLVQQIDAGQAPYLEQVLESDALGKLRSDLAVKRAEYQQKLGQFKPGFPEMVQLQGQIREMTDQLAKGTQAIAQSIKLKYQEATAKEEDLRAKLAELEQENVAYQDKNIQYTILKREVDSQRSQYDGLISKLNDAGVSSELRTQNMSVVDAAVAPGAPFSPSLSRNVMMALLLAGVVGAAIIYVLELLNNTFTNPEQIEKEIGLSVLGILPRVEERTFQTALLDQKSGISEAYRSLRTSLQFSGTEGAPRTLLVTSSEPAEGKSTTSLKLAQDFAALGARVIVIDADLRKPNLHRLISLDNAVGLSNILTNTVRKEDLSSIIRKTTTPNVMAITSGTIPPNPADLLSSPKMALILRALSSKFDLVVIDAPPVVGLSDAPILSRLAEATLFVISTNQVTRKAAKTAVKRVKAAGGHVVGAVMSKFAINKFDYNYSYSYKYMNYQYYSYGGDKGEKSDAAPEVGGQKSLGLGWFGRRGSGGRGQLGPADEPVAGV